jgi:K+ transporter
MIHHHVNLDSLELLDIIYILHLSGQVVVPLLNALLNAQVMDVMMMMTLLDSDLLEEVLLDYVIK